ncbi:MAG TPA: hypothetical protein VMA75_02205 [Candidatus Paceibacterota bacterium]|nr:hypothetical protein [Candidatus Paceibacterota bacterium]
MSIQHLGLEGCGWYIKRKTADIQKPDYLHSDGVWRKTTYQLVDGKKIFTGYFSTEEEARSACDGEVSTGLPIAA